MKKDKEKNTDTTKEKKKISPVPFVIILIVVLAAAIAAGGVGLGYCGYNYLYESTGSTEIVADDVYVNDIAVGGMTMEEAREAMTGVEDKLAATVKVDILVGDKKYRLTKKDLPCSFNTDEVFEDIKAYSAEKGFEKEGRKYEIKMTTDTSKTASIVQNIAEETYVEPVDARVAEFNPDDDVMFVYESEQYGQKLDEEDLTKKMKALFKKGAVSGKIEAVTVDVEPSITQEFLENNIVKLASFSTESSNNDNGNNNMKISLKACNGSVIDPGEIWSFNDCTGDSNLESNGYKEAGVIVDGERGTGIGGGICQSSTTIYNAGILSGMVVEERYCHYYQSTYVDAGRDATIDYGNLDLKLSNPFEYQLFMKCWMKGTKLTCEIYGVQSPDFDQIKITTSDPKQGDDNSYTVKAWRVYYLGGETVKKEELPESTYYTS